MRVKEGTPPSTVDYDLWIGPAPMRPFHPSHFHFNWRYWWDFGGGTLADFGCHYMDLPFWALDLRYPTSVEAKGEKTSQGDNEVPDNMRVDYHFPARGNQPPVHLTWYHGGWKPEGAEDYGKNSAVLFEGAGASGRLLADYRTRKFFMLDGTEPTPPPRRFPTRSAIGPNGPRPARRAGRRPATSTTPARWPRRCCWATSRIAPAARSWPGTPSRCKATDCSEADPFIRREYRPGWTL